MVYVPKYSVLPKGVPSVSLVRYLRASSRARGSGVGARAPHQLGDCAEEERKIDSRSSTMDILLFVKRNFTFSYALQLLSRRFLL